MREDLIVVPTFGLANRMRIVATAYKLALVTGKNLHIYWRPDTGLNAKWHDLFDSPGTLTTLIDHKLPWAYKFLLRTHGSSAIKLLRYPWSRMLNIDFVYTDLLAARVWSGELNLEREMSKAKKALIFGGQDLNYFNAEDYLKLFVPKYDLLQKIDLYTNKFNKLTMGVHIRSTDNEWSKKSSPFSAFIEKMEKEIDLQPTVNFFVATDNQLYQEALLKQFGSQKIMFHEKVFSRNEREGIRDALVDMFCLSRTSKIIGSYFSSFSEVAGLIGNVKVEVVKV